MLTELVVFAYVHPTATFAFLAVLGIILWLIGYSIGNRDGHVEQHEQEMSHLCSYDGEVKFEVVNKLGDHWLVTSIMQRRGRRKNL